MKKPFFIIIIIVLTFYLFKTANAGHVIPPQALLQNELNSCKDQLDLEMNYVNQLQSLRNGYELQILKAEKQIYQLSHSPTPTSTFTPTATATPIKLNNKVNSETKLPTSIPTPKL